MGNKYKRREIKTKKEQERLQISQVEQALIGKINDVAEVGAKASAVNAEGIARIDRETNEFMRETFNPNMGKVNILKTKINTLIDIILEIDGLELTKEQLKILELEEEKPEKKLKDPEEEKKVIADA
jgi:hypothetical protein